MQKLRILTNLIALIVDEKQWIKNLTSLYMKNIIERRTYIDLQECSKQSTSS